MPAAIAEVVAARRRGQAREAEVGDAAAAAVARQRFTVSREQALLQLRNLVRSRGGDPWAWTLPIVRAANGLNAQGEPNMTLQ